MRKLYAWVLGWANSPFAGTFLFFIAMAESIFFPIPPDILLLPLCLGDRKKALFFAGITTVGSLIGGMAGYALGSMLWWSGPNQFSGLAQWFFAHIPGFHEDTFFKVKGLYETHNFWIVFVAAFTPIPYKVITISAGAFDIHFFLFVLAGTVGRAARFFLVAGLIRILGEPVKAFIEKYLNILSLVFVVLLIGGFLLIKVFLD